MASIDPSIPLSIRPVSDPTELYLRIAQLRALKQDERLRAIQQQEAEMRLADLTRQQQDQSALRDAYTAAARRGVSTAYSSPELSMSYNHAPEMLQGSPLPVPGMSLGSLTLPKRDISVKGPGVDNNVLLSELQQTAPHLVPQVQQQMSAQAMEQQKAVAGLRESLAKASKEELGVMQQRNALLGSHLLALKTAPPEQRAQIYPQVVASAEQQGLIPPGSQPQSYPGDAWLDGHLAEAQTVDQYIKAEHDAKVAAETQRHNATTESLTERGQNVTMRGQNMVDKRAMEANRIAQTRANEKPPSEGERNAFSFYTRAKQAADVLDQLEPQIQQMGFGNTVRMNNAPNWAQSDLQQQYNQAKRMFTQAKLRRESGAAISNAEYEQDNQTFFAQPGDSEQVRMQKKAAREAIMRELRVASGRAYSDTYGDGGGQPSGSAGYVRIQASDGSIHDIPQQNISAARQRDPGLKVIQ